MPSSSIPAVLANYLAAVEADAQLGDNGAGITIIEGLPTDRPTGEYLAVGGVTMTQRWAALGNRARDEDYLIGCRLSCRDVDNNTPALARVRAFDLLARVESICRGQAGQPAFGVTGVWDVEFVQLDYQPYIDSDTKAFSAELGFSVHVQARI